jgi:hypothetical protein
MIKLSLGCGEDYRSGYVNIDRSPEVKTDYCFDIAQEGLTSRFKEVDEIHSGCMLEQLTPEQFMFVVNECWQVLREGGKLEGYVPSTDPRVLHLDPMDILFFQEDSFKYLCRDEIHYQRFGKSYGFLPWSSYKASRNSEGIIFFELIK